MSATDVELLEPGEPGIIPASFAPSTPEAMVGLPFLSAIETDPGQMSDDDLAQLVAYAFAKISGVVPYILELRRRFAKLPRGHAHICGCRTWTQFCEQVLHRTDSAVRKAIAAEKSHRHKSDGDTRTTVKFMLELPTRMADRLENFSREFGAKGGCWQKMAAASAWRVIRFTLFEDRNYALADEIKAWERRARSNAHPLNELKDLAAEAAVIAGGAR